MKLLICDVCASEGKTIEATNKTGYRKSGNTAKIDVCKEHLSYGKGMTFEEFWRKSVKLSEMIEKNRLK
jgi:hypothetical protein